VLENQVKALNNAWDRLVEKYNSDRAAIRAELDIYQNQLRSLYRLANNTDRPHKPLEDKKIADYREFAEFHGLVKYFDAWVGAWNKMVQAQTELLEQIRE